MSKDVFADLNLAKIMQKYAKNEINMKNEIKQN